MKSIESFEGVVINIEHIFQDVDASAKWEYKIPYDVFHNPEIDRMYHDMINLLKHLETQSDEVIQSKKK